MRNLLYLPAILLASFPVWADEAPLVRPSRDVVVQYRVIAKMRTALRPPAAPIRIHFARQGTLLRVEIGDARTWLIADRVKGTMTNVSPSDQAYNEVPYDAATFEVFEAKETTFRKTGTDTVADTPCVTYQAVTKGVSSDICLTEDGVLLRSKSASAREDYEAVSVSYAPRPAWLFEIPKGYHKVTDRPPEDAGTEPAKQ